MANRTSQVIDLDALLPVRPVIAKLPEGLSKPTGVCVQCPASLWHVTIKGSVRNFCKTMRALTWSPNETLLLTDCDEFQRQVEKRLRLLRKAEARAEAATAKAARAEEKAAAIAARAEAKASARAVKAEERAATKAARVAAKSTADAVRAEERAAASAARAEARAAAEAAKLARMESRAAARAANAKAPAEVGSIQESGSTAMASGVDAF